MGGRGGNSGMTSVRASNAVAIPTDGEIDKLKFVKGELRSGLLTSTPQYTATVGDFGRAVINKNEDHSYSAMFFGNDGRKRYNWYENFDDFNSAKRNLRNAIKDFASKARGSN